MPYCKHLNVSQDDITRCTFDVNVYVNVLECSCCCFFLEKHKQKIVDEIINETQKLPKEVTRIKIPLLPLPTNTDYYSYTGIESIIYYLFKTNDYNLFNHLTNHQAYLKVYYEKNSLFYLPIIQVEVIFFGRLEETAIEELWKILKAEVLYFTSSIGDIDVISIRGRNHLSDLLRIPLLVGYPEFKQNSILTENKFTDSQIKEMNYLHSFTLLPLFMNEVINNTELGIFTIQKMEIEKEMNLNNDFANELSDDESIEGFESGSEITLNEDFDYESDEIPF
jgi:hypothetical protein